MNIYEQLQALKSDLEKQGARAKSVRVIDAMLARAASQRESALSVSRLQVLRHVMGTREVLNDEEIRLDFLGLEGTLEDQAAQRATERPAYEDVDRRPKLKKYYKKKG